MAGFSFDHVHISSPDPFATAQWFADNFGADVVNPWREPNGVGHVIVNLKGANIFIKGRADKPKVKSNCSSAYGLEHFAIVTDDLNGAVAALKARGNTFTLDVSPTLLAGVRHAFLNGPDDTLIELIERNPA